MQEAVCYFNITINVFSHLSYRFLFLFFPQRRKNWQEWLQICAASSARGNSPPQPARRSRWPISGKLWQPPWSPMYLLSRSSSCDGEAVPTSVQGGAQAQLAQRGFLDYWISGSCTAAEVDDWGRQPISRLRRPWMFQRDQPPIIMVFWETKASLCHTIEKKMLLGEKQEQVGGLNLPRNPTT